MTVLFYDRWQPYPPDEETTCQLTPNGMIWRRGSEVVAVDLASTASATDPAVDAMREMTPNPKR
jgi:hypothetical protein